MGKEELNEVELLKKEIQELKESKDFWAKESTKWESKFKNLKKVIESIIAIVE